MPAQDLSEVNWRLAIVEGLREALTPPAGSELVVMVMANSPPRTPVGLLEQRRILSTELWARLLGCSGMDHCWAAIPTEEYLVVHWPIPMRGSVEFELADPLLVERVQQSLEGAVRYTLEHRGN